eukprot:GHVU01217644.1.p2 GENE.GHVU01217644.1~~GHVU01217644.1.p2  ORF type:complete len:103 (+),score=3.06 GHVU01217644.1:148-456(+)
MIGALLSIPRGSEREDNSDYFFARSLQSPAFPRSNTSMPAFGPSSSVDIYHNYVKLATCVLPWTTQRHSGMQKHFLRRYTRPPPKYIGHSLLSHFSSHFRGL